MCAALTATIIAPAKAGPSAETLIPAAGANLPQVTVPDPLDLEVEPVLSEPKAEDAQIRTETEELLEETLGDTTEAEPAPTIKPVGDLASMVAQLRGFDPGNRELECLAVGIYFESKSEPLAGQLAVGQVIANRANSKGRFPGSYCGVLFQRGQFSFIRGRSWPAVKRSSKQWQNAVAVARIVDQELHQSTVGNALFFHARYVSPRWRLKRVAAIGNHIFYR